MIFAVTALNGCGCSKDEKSSAEDAISGSQDGTMIYLAKLDEGEFDDLSDDLLLNCVGNVEAVSIDEKLSPQEALEKMFVYDEYTKGSGLYNIFEMSNDLKVDNLLIQNDFAIVTLSEELNLGTNNSECAYAQIRKTLTQFDGIDGVDIFIGDKELSTYVSERESGE